MNIKLNDILNFSEDELKNTKIKFNLMFGGNWNPIEIFKNNDKKLFQKGSIGIIQKTKFLKKDKTPLVLFVLKTIYGYSFILEK